MPTLFWAVPAARVKKVVFLLEASSLFRIRRAAATLAALSCAALLAGCAKPGQPADLVAGASKALVEADVVGRNLEWVKGQTGWPLRLNDVVRQTLPASPPSRLRFVMDVPERARLAFAIGIAPEHQREAGVEFVIRARSGKKEKVVFQQLLEPLTRPEHRLWVEAQAPLAEFAGKAVELTFETRGFEKGEALRRAFWGAPALVVDERREEAPLVIVYLVDTLRADHTTPYGYKRDTTPELQKFAKDAVVFEQPIVHASWTKPSIASIFTSQLPGRHRTVQLRDSLDPGLVTLAEMLKTKGFATGGAVANSVIYSAGTHFEQGFDFWAGLHGEGGRPSKLVFADKVVDTALQWLDSRPGLPNFVYVHTMDPHVPYEPPPPFDRMFPPHPREDYPAIDPRTDYREPEDLERLKAQYDGSIAYGDREFGRFVRELKERGLYDRALIVFTSDHGEEFMDHGGFLHGRTVFDELIRVPLIVKFPKQRDAGKRVKQQVQGVDLLPTILKELGLPVPEPPVIHGHPLQKVMAGGAPEPPAVSEISHRGFVAHGMRTGKDKYVRRFSPMEDELYFDLLQDPREQESRLEQAKERVRTLKAGVEAAMVPNPFRHTLRFVGNDSYELRLATGGWVEGVEALHFGSGESHGLEGNGRKLVLKVRPRPGQPREVVFSVRPQGAPVRLEGTRNGRPLRPQDVWIAQEAIHPDAVPVRLPEIESEHERGVEHIFGPPPADRIGIHVWLVMAPGKSFMSFDDETLERLKALGYVQ